MDRKGHVRPSAFRRTCVTKLRGLVYDDAMSIRFSPRAPSDALDRIREHLSRDSDVPTTRGMKSLRGRPSMGTSDGIETWVLGLDEAETGALDQAQPNAWRYLVFEGERALSEAHLHTDAGASTVTAMVEGPTTTGLLGAFAVAEGLDAMQSHDFEPRLLLVPSVTFVALWLHATETGVDDVFIPIPPSQLPLAHGTPVTMQQVVSALQVAAGELRVKMDAAPGPSGGSGGDAAIAPGDSCVPGILRVWPLRLDEVTFDSEDTTREHEAPRTLKSTLPTETRGTQLPRFMQRQEQSNWCWAAVATSVGLLLETGRWTQCDTASRCFSPARSCCGDPERCNEYGYLDKALDQTMSLDFHENAPAKQKRIKRHIEEGRPVCTRVAWDANGAHFMAITGYSLDDDDEMTITIQDPQHGICSMRLSDYPGRYPAGSGTWTHTYYCKR